jgi:hypothetical protein
VSESGRWYWRHNLIEPNARGASEIRRVWWDVLQQSTKQIPTLPAA